MATTIEINRILADGALAYPAYDKAKLAPALKHYVKALAAFDGKVIELAMDSIIAENKFYPSVSELVNGCRQVEANNRPNQVAAARQGDVLRERAFELEDKRAAGYFIPEQWGELARSFEQVGRVEAANHLRAKAGLAYVFEPYEVEQP